MEITVYNERQDILQKCGTFNPVALRMEFWLLGFNRVKTLYMNGHSDVRFL